MSKSSAVALRLSRRWEGRGWRPTRRMKRVRQQRRWLEIQRQLNYWGWIPIKISMGPAYIRMDGITRIECR